jgi:hypothetical protein
MEDNQNNQSDTIIEAITQDSNIISKRIAFTKTNLKNLSMMAFREFYDSDLNNAEKLSAMLNKIIAEYNKDYVARLVDESNNS